MGEGVKKLSNGKTEEPKQQERLFPPRFQFFHSFEEGEGGGDLGGFFTAHKQEGKS